MTEQAPRKIIGREAAAAAGLSRYFSDEPCQHGHIAERRVRGNACVECDRLRDAARRKRAGYTHKRKPKPRPPRKSTQANFKAGPGRGHKHVPTDANRKVVMALSGSGVTQEEIRKLIPDVDGRGPLHLKVLRRNYRHELDVGYARMYAQVLQSAFRQATGADAIYDQYGRLIRPARDAVPAVTIFWLKVRRGWKQPPDEHRFAGAGGGPIQHLDVGGANTDILSGFTDEELALLEKLSQKIADSAAGGNPGGKGPAKG
jgi:hypothetical protein